jgi:S1-C subfamily serine protease/predicted esterase
MRCRAFTLTLLSCFSLAGLQLAAQPPAADDLESLQEKAMKAAVARVAPSVVQIETSGGADLIGGGGPGGPQIRKGTGPTTGLIVAPDGYIISSAFNFANKPSAIFIAIPGQQERLVAKVIATDQTRMLTLLKVEASKLPVPVPTPKKEIKVGQWGLALGRTWSAQDATPSLSIGIISAVDRIWGKAIQTDAKVSPVNYGGPLVDLEGRVMGVLVPASPRGQDETAGVEWYDSGIGFAIPLEDINAALPKLRQGKDLKRGMLGITLKSTDIYGAVPEIASVAPDSAALRAGIKPNDVVTEINGIPVVRQAQILHLLGDKYDGDTVSVKVRRGKEVVFFPNLKLSATNTSFSNPFLGVLPLRDDPEPGEEVRFVFPQSPAETAGIKAGDRIMKIGLSEGPMQPFSGRDELQTILERMPAGTPIRVEVKRKASKKTETLKLTLASFSEQVPEQLPEPASLKKALAPRKPAIPVPPMPPTQPMPPMPPMPKKEDEEKKEPKKPPEKGLLKRTTPTRDHEFWVYVPENYDPNISHGLVVWLHPAGKAKDRETEHVVAVWEDFCSENHLILLCPKAESENGWVGSELDFVRQTIRDLVAEYTIDSQRVVAHGMGVGGQMAFYLGFHARELIRGVATTGAVLNNPVKDNLANQRLSFFIVAGGKDPLAESISATKNKLIEGKFPVVYHEVPEQGHEYLDAVTLRELVRWVDSLDRQ